MVTQLVFPEDQGLSISKHMQVLERIATFRHEWEVAADGQSLLEVNTSIGFVLVDLTKKLGLTSDEKYMVLGSKLYGELGTLFGDQAQR